MFNWSLAKLRNVERRVERLFPGTAKQLSGLIGQEPCDVENFDFSGGKPIFFKNLHRFWSWLPRYNEGNTLLIDDNRYKCECNRPGTYFVVLKEQKNDWGDDQ